MSDQASENNSFSSIFINRPIATSLLMCAIFLSGLLAYRLLPVSSLPEIDYPTIQVSTHYPGASSNVMAISVTSPLERQLGQMPGLMQMSSISSQDMSIITLQFNLSLSLDVAQQQVQAAINAASGYLPKALPNPPTYSKINPADTPIITLSLTSRNLPLEKVEDYAETSLVQKISQMNGVGRVSVSGGKRPAVRIQIDNKRLASYGLTSSDIRSVIDNENVNSPKGNFDGKNVTYTIETNDQVKSAKEYEELIISYGDNAAVKLKDVAKVVDSAENIYQAAWVDKMPAILINIQRQSGANIIKVAEDIKSYLPQLSASIPKDIDIRILSDRTKSIKASIADVEFELILSILLVVLVVYLFLGEVEMAIIPAIAVPLSLVASLAVVYSLGFSLNNLTLMALTIATGFVVDDAIVMTENITRFIEKGYKPLDAALKGAGQIVFTILSLTISLVAVLIPLLLMGDIAGMLFREFAVTLAASILISGFVSLTLTPMLCAIILKSKLEAKRSYIGEVLHSRINEMIEYYKVSLRFVLRHQKETLGLFISTFFLTFILFYIVPKGFFPEQDTRIIQAVTEMSPKASFDQIERIQQDIGALILEESDTESIASFIGIDGINNSMNNGRIIINLKDKGSGSASSRNFGSKIKKKIRERGVQCEVYLQNVRDLTIESRVTKSQYQLSLNAPDRNDVMYYSQAIMDELSKSPALTPYIENVATDQAEGALQINLKIRRDDAARYGISMQNIVDSLYDSYGQRQVSTIFSERNQYHVVLETSRNQDEVLDNIYVPSISGTIVPLRAIADISIEPSSLLLTRLNQFPSATISFDLKDNTSLGYATSIVNDAIKKLDLPKSLNVSFQGSASAFENASVGQVALVIGAIVTVYIVLGILYESYIHPLTILSTLPPACIGALIALIICGMNLDIISIIGIILLIGIVKKNAIMMIDFALEEERASNATPEVAIFEACVLRFRPIMMTTMAALLGAVPLALSSGMGSEIRSPLGVTIIGGLVLSQLMTLYTTPAIYLAFSKWDFVHGIQGGMKDGAGGEFEAK